MKPVKRWVRKPTTSEAFTVRDLSRIEVPLWFHVYSTKPHPNTALTFAKGWGNTRFAPIKQADGSSVHTYYAASTAEAACMESVLHDAVLAPPGVFDTSALDRAFIATLALHNDLKYVSLHTPFLPKLGVTRSELIDSPAAAYEETREWAQALFLTCPEAQAIGYGSRRDDAARCLMLFEQRLTAPPLFILGDEPLATGVRRDEVLTLVRSLGMREI